MQLETRPWDAAATLETREDIAAYLDAVLEDGDLDLLKAALRDIARANGLMELAETAGVDHVEITRALSPEGSPDFATVARLFRAIGLKLRVSV